MGNHKDLTYTSEDQPIQESPNITEGFLNSELAETRLQLVHYVNTDTEITSDFRKDAIEKEVLVPKNVETHCSNQATTKLYALLLL